MATPALTNAGGPDDRLATAAATAQRLHVTLEDLIQHPSGRGDDGNRRTTISHSTPPWNAQAAYLIFELGATARLLESNLRAVTSSQERPRGGSDLNTQLALQALAPLGSGADEATVTYAATRLEGWCHRARTAIGEVEPFDRLPRLPGQREPRCPWCRRETLRCQRYAGLVRCVNPSCRDQAGERPRARIELGRYTQCMILVWHDGTSGLAYDEDEVTLE